MYENERFERNIGAITCDEQELLKTKKAVIAGCGGLGCHTAEFLARLGIGFITIIDGDAFTASNLNRQLNSLETNLGKSKVHETRERLLQIRADLPVNVFNVFLNEENAGKLLEGHDIIIDALDSVKTRLLLEKKASKLDIPLVHGAVQEWSAQVSTIFPGDFTLSRLYQGDYHENSDREKPSVLSFTAAFCASLEASEAVKVLLGRGSLLRKKLLTVDLKENTFDIISL